MFRLGVHLSTRVLPIVFLLLLLLYALANQAGLSAMTPPQLLTDPFLQLPTATSVRVVWFTEFSGTRHFVSYGENFDRTAPATTTQLSRTREDQDSKWPPTKPIGNTQTTPRPTASLNLRQRPIWRHEAEVTGLQPHQRWPYRVTSMRAEGQSVTSRAFTLTANPAPGQPLKILLTSDHQLKPMVAANLQKVQETIGRVDAVFVAGDLINVPDRASEWFDDAKGGAFFPALQGRASYALTKNGQTTQYRGGELIQHAPLFAAIGNHEVMGRWATDQSLNEQFNHPAPRPPKSSDGPRAAVLPTNLQQLKNQSFNTDTYEEIFTFPTTSPGGKQYYAVTFGDVRLVVLYATNIWRVPELKNAVRRKYREPPEAFHDPQRRGNGQFIFEPIHQGSQQYTWLEQELQSADFKRAKYKVVMVHHPPHSLGENVVPAYTDPVASIAADEKGQITSWRYEYPKSRDYLIRDVVPLLARSGVQLVFYGHSHLWNRFVSPQGMHFLETSNVGNSYGAYVDGNQRHVPNNALAHQVFGEPLLFPNDYAATGNPNGLPPVMPTIAPLSTPDGKPLPYIASNDITAFSILDTGSGQITSYRFDTREPNAKVIKFDQFHL
jgi:Calcineurin-like phosphoesterase